MAGGLLSLSLSQQTLFSWQATISPGQGGYFGPNANTTRIQKAYTLSTPPANNLTGGCDQFTSFQQGIVAGGSATIDMYAFTSIFGASVTSARNKGRQIRLLSAADDPTISPAPVVTSTVTVTNNGAVTPHPLNFGDKGTGLTLTFTVTAGAISVVSIGGAGAGSGYLPSATFIVAVNTAVGSGGVISVVTNSTGVPTTVAVVTGGSSYTNTNNAATSALWAFSLNTGDAEFYIDVSNAGVTTSATKRGFKIVNNDAVNPVTVEIDLPLPTS